MARMLGGNASEQFGIELVQQVGEIDRRQARVLIW